MRRLSIPQKPDRPDIDDLIFGDDHKTQSEKQPHFLIGSTQGLQRNSSRVVFLYLFLKGNI